MQDKSITVVIPCYNESTTITKVVRDFRCELPYAKIMVVDNNSTDGTPQKAKDAGARVFLERRQGKGYVAQSAFAYIRSDILVIVDGDDTYDAGDVHVLLAPVLENGADVVVGNRLGFEKRGFSHAHHFGNSLFRLILNFFFRTQYKDILSGYRVMKRDFYARIPLLSTGFEVETEMTLQALERGYRVEEVPIHYKERPEDSHSKIREFYDGFRILFTVLSLLRDYRPMTFFSYASAIFFIASLYFGSTVIREYLVRGEILRVPTAILAVSLGIVGIQTFLSGIILSAVNRRQREIETIIRKNK